tara:strand:+ start:842 stop:1669 length:828 start_codon:yes stop_codon:yes gene_type:complete
MECFKDNKTADLFLEINPNIDEIAKEQEQLSTESTIEKKQCLLKQEKYGHEDVFESNEPPKKKGRPKSKPKSKQSIEHPKQEQTIQPQEHLVEEELEDLQNEILEPKEVALPITYREKKKRERKKLKDEEKEIKRIEKDKHREVMKEKNRAKARERYHRVRDEKQIQKKEEQTLIPKQIVEESTKKLNSFQKRDLNTKMKSSNDMDFVTFTNYMLKYEDLKTKFNKQKHDEEQLVRQQQKQQQEQEQPQSKSPFPSNYPVHLIYGNKKKKRNNIF